MPTVRKATQEDAVKVASNLRQADRNECFAYTGLPPQVVLPLSVSQNEHTWAMINDSGEPFGLFGVTPVYCYPDMGIVWMCSTPEIEDYKRDLIKMAPRWLHRLHKLYPLLGNHVDIRNTKHTKWLKRMGFSFLRVLPEYGVERRPFIEFARLETR